MKKITITLSEDMDSGVASLRVVAENLAHVEAIGMLSNALHQHIQHCNNDAQAKLNTYIFEKSLEKPKELPS